MNILINVLIFIYYMVSIFGQKPQEMTPSKKCKEVKCMVFLTVVWWFHNLQCGIESHHFHHTWCYSYFSLPHDLEKFSAFSSIWIFLSPSSSQRMNQFQSIDHRREKSGRDSVNHSLRTSHNDYVLGMLAITWSMKSLGHEITGHLGPWITKLAIYAGFT